MGMVADDDDDDETIMVPKAARKAVRHGTRGRRGAWVVPAGHNRSWAKLFSLTH